jgi:predicted permease
MGSLLNDARYAIRSAFHRPSFSALAIIVLALGIGAATAVFSVVDQTVLRRPPFLHSDRLVDVQNIRRGGGGGSGHSAEKVLGWRDQASVFERLETFVPQTFDLTRGRGEPERVTALAVSPGLLDMLGVQPQVGRGFTADDAAPGSQRLLLVSRRLAERRLGGTAASLGAIVTLSGQGHTVVGVMPDTFTLLGREQAWVPIDPRHHLGRPRVSDFFILGRLAPGLTIPQAQARANQIADRLQADTPLARTWDIRIDEKRVAATSPSARSAMLALLGAVVCLLLLACVSVMQLVLSRTGEQRRELAIRASLGASRGALVRQVLVEVGLVALVGAALGIVGATWTVRLFAASTLSPLAFWRTAPVTVDGRILAASIAVTLAAIAAAGLLPALLVSRSMSRESLGVKAGAVITRTTERMSFALVATQVACAVVLAVGAGLMFRTISNVSRIPLGFEPEGLIVMNVDLPASRYSTEASRFAFFERVLERLRQAPDISAAAVAGGLTFYGVGRERFSSTEVPELADDAAMNSISDGYFETLRVRLLTGRSFTPQDMGSQAVVIGRTLAARLWPSGRAVGSTMRTLDDERTWTVIGVVDDLDARPSHDRPIALQWYVPRSTSPDPSVPVGRGPLPYAYHRLIVRAASPGVGLAAAKVSVWAVDPEQPIERVTRARDEVRNVFASHHLGHRLTTAFSVIGLVVAAVGVFGVLSQVVARRRWEIGVRMALGATPGRIRGMVVGRAGFTIAMGLATGIVSAAALTRWLQAVLYGIAPWDYANLVAAAMLVTATGLAAAWWPARTAARAVAIREE